LAEKDVNFRAIFGEVLVDASKTCGDRVALSMLHFGVQYKLATVDITNTKDVAELLIRGQLALSMLENRAQEKIKSLRFVDEIKVYLGYPVMLKEKLNLPIDVKEMIYFRYSAITKADLDSAESFVKGKIENPTERNAYLIKELKWIEALKAKYKERAEVLINNRQKALDEGTYDEDANKTYREGMLALTKEHFNDH
jgi:hypothetical protein